MVAAYSDLITHITTFFRSFSRSFSLKWDIFTAAIPEITFINKETIASMQHKNCVYFSCQKVLAEKESTVMALPF